MLRICIDLADQMSQKPEAGRRRSGLSARLGARLLRSEREKERSGARKWARVRAGNGNPPSYFHPGKRAGVKLATLYHPPGPCASLPGVLHLSPPGAPTSKRGLKRRSIIVHWYTCCEQFCRNAFVSVLTLGPLLRRAHFWGPADSIVDHNIW